MDGPDDAQVKSSLFWVQEQKKSSKLEESMKMLDYEMKKTDDLLYRMIPKPVAKRLRKGEPAVNTCEVRSVATSWHMINNSIPAKVYFDVWVWKMGVYGGNLGYFVMFSLP